MPHLISLCFNRRVVCPFRAPAGRAFVGRDNVRQRAYSKPDQPELDALRAEITRLQNAIADQQADLKKLEDRLNQWQAAPVAESQPIQAVAAQPDTSTSNSSSSAPLDFSGYFSTRYSRIANPASSNYDQETVSLFVDKTIGPLKFHSELEYEYGPILLSSVSRRDRPQANSTRKPHGSITSIVTG